MLLAERLRAVLAVDPSAPCLEFDDAWLTWGDLDRQAGHLQTELAVAPGMGVNVVLRNDPATVAALVAVLRNEAAVVAVSPHGPAPAVASGWPMPGVAVEMLTSGTTGPPKRVPLTYETFSHVLNLQGEPTLRSGTRIVWAPLAHIGGLWGVLQTLVEGRRISLMERFEIGGWVERVDRHRPAVTGLPPAGLRMLLDAGVDAARLAPLRAVTTGTAAAPASLVEEFEAHFGIPVLATYGATEFAGAIASWTLADHERFGRTKRGSVGRPHPGVEVRIGAGGVLEARGAQLGPEWVRTSDLARVDDDGFLWIDGRADDTIIRGGFKVSAGAVAKVLEQHPLVAAAAVVGMDDRRLGQVPVAAVEPVAGATPSDLDAFLRQRLAAYQVPVAIHLVQRLPRTPSLKIDAVAVREMVGVSE